MTVAGEELLLCGYAGLEGTLRILDESEEELGTRFVPVFLERRNFCGKSWFSRIRSSL